MKVKAHVRSHDGGSCNRPRFRQAYCECADFLVVHPGSIFKDLGDLPENVAFDGPIGSPPSCRTMVRYTCGDA